MSTTPSDTSSDTQRNTLIDLASSTDAAVVLSVAEELTDLSDAIDELHDSERHANDRSLYPIRERVISAAVAIDDRIASFREALSRQGMLAGERKSVLASLSVALDLGVTGRPLCCQWPCDGF